MRHVYRRLAGEAKEHMELMADGASNHDTVDSTAFAMNCVLLL